MLSELPELQKSFFMARKRMIDPSIWADESFGMLSTDAMILFIGIISNADDQGRLPGNSLFLSSTILPYKAFTKTQAEKIRDEILSAMKSVVLYAVDGKEYIQLQKWHFYQAINKPSGSKYPPLPEDYRSTTVVLPPNRIEENRREEKENGKLSHSINYLENPLLDDIKEFVIKFKVNERQIREKASQLYTYCKMHGKLYKDYKAFLRNAIQKDYEQRDSEESVDLLTRRMRRLHNGV